MNTTLAPVATLEAEHMTGCAACSECATAAVVYANAGGRVRDKFWSSRADAPDCWARIVFAPAR